MRTITVLFLLYARLLCNFQACLAKDFLNAGENITGTSFLVSADQRFVFGFFFPAESPAEAYLGIWYNHTQYPGKTVLVWAANRDNPVAGTDVVFQIEEDGNLAVTKTSSRVRYWSSELERSSSANRTVKLMDSGNLVLLQHDHNGTSYIWQSFQHPTNTFLPGMEMDTDLNLTSWRHDGSSGLGSGSFTFKMAQTGNNRYLILNSQHQLHWEFNGLNSDALSPDTLNYLSNFTSHSSKYVNKSSTWKSLYLTYQDTRIVMNSTGEIQYLKWENSEWIMLWNQPSDKCNIYNFCGNFSSCDADDWMPCKCLPGFTHRSAENQNYEGGLRFPGCVRESTSYDNNIDMTFLNLKKIRVGTPDQRNATETETECRSLCLNMSHPQCQAYSYNRSSYNDRNPSPFTCGIWTRDLTTLQVAQDGGGDLSVLVKSSDIGNF